MIGAGSTIAVLWRTERRQWQVDFIIWKKKLHWLRQWCWQRNGTHVVIVWTKIGKKKFWHELNAICILCSSDHKDMVKWDITGQLSTFLLLGKKRVKRYNYCIDSEKRDVLSLSKTNDCPKFFNVGLQNALSYMTNCNGVRLICFHRFHEKYE